MILNVPILSPLSNQSLSHHSAPNIKEKRSEVPTRSPALIAGGESVCGVVSHFVSTLCHVTATA